MLLFLLYFILIFYFFRNTRSDKLSFCNFLIFEEFAVKIRYSKATRNHMYICYVVINISFNVRWIYLAPNISSCVTENREQPAPSGYCDINRRNSWCYIFISLNDGSGLFTGRWQNTFPFVFYWLVFRSWF